MNPYSQRRTNVRVHDLSNFLMMTQPMAYEPLMMFIEEMIDYSLCEIDITDWIPPLNLQYLRLRHPDKLYFDAHIGEAIAHSCTERNAHRAAHGFQERSWFTLDPDEARERLIECLELMWKHAEVPVEVAALHVFSFGCYVAREAMKRQLNGTANEVVRALVQTCSVHFPYERQYASCSFKAEAYSLDHRCRRRK